MEKSLPPIPAKRYFTIGEVGELCDVKPHVLRYWEQEFTQLRPVKRRGNRRYYQHHEVLMIRRISDLLYAQGFTISGARNQLQEMAQLQREGRKQLLQPVNELQSGGAAAIEESRPMMVAEEANFSKPRLDTSNPFGLSFPSEALRLELLEIRQLLAE